MAGPFAILVMGCFALVAEAHTRAAGFALIRRLTDRQSTTMPTRSSSASRTVRRTVSQESASRKSAEARLADARAPRVVPGRFGRPSRFPAFRARRRLQEDEECEPARPHTARPRSRFRQSEASPFEAAPPGQEATRSSPHRAREARPQAREPRGPAGLAQPARGQPGEADPRPR